MGDNARDLDRPSFTAFWKKSSGREIRFVDGRPHEDTGHAGDHATRRSQVSEENVYPELELRGRFRLKPSRFSSADKNTLMDWTRTCLELLLKDAIFRDESATTSMYLETKGTNQAGDDQDDKPDAGASLDKAQLRRAQVRKAQTQHRQRKANYVKQLEMDIAHLREMIAVAQRDTHGLLAENQAMRAQIQQTTKRTDWQLALDQGVSLLDTTPDPPQLSSEASAGLQQEVEGLTLTLGFDEVMNAPCYYISSPPSSTAVSRQQSVLGPDEASPPTDNRYLPELTPSQTQQAINFILALEHICRDHFHPSLYSATPTATEPAPVPSAPLIGHSANGHTLMASSLALRSAPRRIFKAASRTRLLPRSAANMISRIPASSSASLSPPSINTTAANTTITAGRTSSRNPNDDSNSPMSSSESSRWSWRTSGLTLRALYGLACSLNPADGAELTPVQAWFELVARFGADALLPDERRPGALDALKRELAGVVKCPHYGASLERAAFESVVWRVLISEPQG